MQIQSIKVHVGRGVGKSNQLFSHLQREFRTMKTLSRPLSDSKIGGIISIKYLSMVCLAVFLAGCSASGSNTAAPDAQATPVLIQQELVSIAGLHAVNPYRGYEWREDALADEAMPLNFRTSSYPFRKPAADSQMDSRYMPSRKGLETLYVSGSAQPSLSGFGGLIQAIRKESKGPIYVVDLRQESHGFFNGTAVSWYGERDWSNINLSHQQVLLDEENRFAASLNQMRAVAPLLADKTAGKANLVHVAEVSSEERVVKAQGAHYFRITATDHVWPSAENIDRFIGFYKTLPPDAWLHFHCEAGKGRTTEFMAIYDIMRNPKVSLKDVLYRQYLLGGNYVAYSGDGSSNWKNPYYRQKAEMIQLFYRYVQANRSSRFTTPWSKWLAAPL